MHPISQPGLELRALILKKAQTEKGFSLTDAVKIDLTDSAIQYVCRSFVARGLVFPIKIKGAKAIHYFATAEAAAQYERDTPPVIYKTKKQREAMARKLLAPVVRVKAYKPPVARAPVEIIYPPGYKKTIAPIHQPRFQAVSHSFVHNGY